MNHTFDVAIAAEYGINCAVILENLRFWIDKNRANDRHFHDGRYWTYSSAKAFAELFPYMTARQVSYALKRLIDNGIIVTGNYNASTYDRTLWYALTDKGDLICRKSQIETTKLSNGNTENVEPIPDINTDIVTDINTDKNESVGHLPHRPDAKAAGRTHTRIYGNQAPHRTPKVNPAQQYEQRKYDDESMKARVTVNFRRLGDDVGWWK